MQVRVPPELENISTDAIELERRGSAMVITIQINGIPARFVVDTGASFTTIHKRSLARFRIDPGSETVPIETANGVIQAPLAYADIQLGRHLLPRSLIVIIPDSPKDDYDGLFGMDSLRKLNAQIDSRSGRLVILGDETEALGSY